MHASQEKGYNPDFNDAILEAVALSGELRKAQSTERDMQKMSKAGQAPTLPKGVNEEDYVKIMGQVDRMEKDTVGGRKAILEKMKGHEKQKLAEVLRYRELIRKIEKMSPKNEEDNGEEFALKMRIEFGLRPEQLLFTLEGIIGEVTGVSVVIDEETEKTMIRMIKELGEKKDLYQKPENFQSLKEFLAHDTVGLGIAANPKGPSEKELNKASKAIIEMLIDRVLRGKVQ